MSLMRSAAVVGSFTLLSRILGFVRDVLSAACLGAGWVNDAFVVAQRFPNLFRSLFAEGAFSSAFVPLFAKRLHSDGRPEAERFAMAIQAILCVSLLVFSALVILGMPFLMRGVASGFADDPQKFAYTVSLSRITFPYLVFMGLCALYAGILNALGRFWVAAAAPILLNIVLVVALIAAKVTAMPQPQIGALLAWALVLSGALQLVWMVAAAHRAGVRLRPVRPRLTPDIRRFFALTLPGAAAAGVTQINVLIGTIIATHQAGAASYLYYADRLYQLPLGVVGIAIGAVLLPDLSRRLAARDHAGAVTAQNRAIEFAMLLTVPCAAALLAAPFEIIMPLFERGAFDRVASLETARALAAFAVGLPAYVLIKALTPAFFAAEDTRTPVVYATASVAVNITASLALFPVVGHVGIAAATAVSAWVNVVLLVWGLRRRGAFAADARLKSRGWRILAASGGMALAVVGYKVILAPLFARSDAVAMAALAGLVLFGGAVYAVLVVVLRASSVSELRTMVRRA